MTDEEIVAPQLGRQTPILNSRVNGLEIKLYPHQSILIRKINITHTTPNHHHKPIQFKYFSS